MVWSVILGALYTKLAGPNCLKHVGTEGEYEAKIIADLKDALLQRPE